MLIIINGITNTALNLIFARNRGGKTAWRNETSIDIERIVGSIKRANAATTFTARRSYAHLRAPRHGYRTIACAYLPSRARTAARY